MAHRDDFLERVKPLAVQATGSIDQMWSEAKDMIPQLQELMLAFKQRDEEEGLTSTETTLDFCLNLVLAEACVRYFNEVKDQLDE